MTDHEIQDHRAAVLLRCAELETHLATTKERLNLAVVQLSELADSLLPSAQSEVEAAPHPEWNDTAFRRIIADVARAELELAEARKLAVSLEEVKAG